MELAGRRPALLVTEMSRDQVRRSSLQTRLVTNKYLCLSCELDIEAFPQGFGLLSSKRPSGASGCLRKRSACQRCSLEPDDITTITTSTGGATPKPRSGTVKSRVLCDLCVMRPPLFKGRIFSQKHGILWNWCTCGHFLFLHSQTTHLRNPSNNEESFGPFDVFQCQSESDGRARFGRVEIHLPGQRGVRWALARRQQVPVAPPQRLHRWHARVQFVRDSFREYTPNSGCHSVIFVSAFSARGPTALTAVLVQSPGARVSVSTPQPIRVSHEWEWVPPPSEPRTSWRSLLVCLSKDSAERKLLFRSVLTFVATSVTRLRNSAQDGCSWDLFTRSPGTTMEWATG